MSRDWYPEYIPVAEKKRKAAEKLKNLRKKMPNITPVVIEGKALARTWWGKSWNKNLTRYADYSNRVGRGRSYVRHGAVLDLKIAAGKVSALVQGSTSKPYIVDIKIKAIQKSDWQEIKTRCTGQLKSLQFLMAAKFPPALNEIFFAAGTGLFPEPKSISFNCSCPDWAYMCKHVAAALFGIGARLDDDPSLLFKLRKVDSRELIAQAVQDKAGEMLAKTAKKSKRVIAATDLGDLFGLDMDVKPDFGKKKLASAQKTSKAKNTAPSRQPKKKQPTQRQTATALIEEIVLRHKKGVTVAMLEEKTGFPRRKIYATTSRLRQLGRITYVAQGVYGRP